jgi:hypothetical protein
MAREKQLEIRMIQRERRVLKWQHILKAITNWNEADRILSEWDLKNRCYFRKIQTLINQFDELVSTLEKETIEKQL